MYLNTILADKNIDFLSKNEMLKSVGEGMKNYRKTGISTCFLYF